MKIYKSTFKDVQSVVVDTGKIVAVFLPTEGGKMASLSRDGVEYLVQNPSEKFLHLSIDGSFEQTECAGFDDMFPTIDPTEIKEGSRKGLLYNDHGEVSRLKFDYQIDDHCLVMKTYSSRLNYNYEKRVSVDADGGIKIDYKVENLSDEEFNCIWAGHALAVVDDGAEIITPFSDGDLVDLVSDPTEFYGKKGARIKFDREMLKFSDTPRNCTYKLYFPQMLDGGEVGVKYADGVTLSMQFSEELKHLGLWIDDGGFKGYRCVGLEPCTRGYDTVYNAQQMGQYGGIKGNKTLEFSLRLTVK